MNKFFFTVLGFTAFLLSGCGHEEYIGSDANNTDPVSITFTVGGVADYGENESTLNRGVTKDSLIYDSSDMCVSMVQGSPTSTRLATTRGILGEGIRYRVLAYKADDGSYAGYADYKVSSNTSLLIGGGLTLEAGNYSFVAYSYNNNNPITDAAETSVINVTIDDNMIYWEGNANVSTNIILPIYFKHLFSQLQIVFDATDFGSDFTEASLSLGLPSGDIYKEGLWSIGSTNISSLKTVFNPVSTFNSLSGMTINSLPIRLLPVYMPAITLNVYAKFANQHYVLEKIQVSTPHSFNPNYTYTYVVKFKASSALELTNRNLSIENGGGNCWVIPSSESEVSYHFDATKEGQTSDPVGTIAITSNSTRLAKLLWEDTSGLISSVPVYLDGRISFKVGANKKGNALIAVTDGDGVVLWSWHIWVVDDNSFMKTLVPSGTFMDRNLGDMSSALGYLPPRSLYYQWGRKDPFYHNDFRFQPDEIGFTLNAISLQTAVRNPTVFSAGDNFYNNWYYNGSLDLWGDSINMRKFNPCPKGWTVMSRSDFENLAHNSFVSGYLGKIVNGVNFPFTGVKLDTPMVSGVNGDGYYWFRDTAYNLSGFYAAFRLTFSTTATYHISPNDVPTDLSINSTTALGTAVRCVRE